MAAVTDQPGVDEASPDPLQQPAPMDMENGVEAEAEAADGNTCCVCHEPGHLLQCKVPRPPPPPPPPGRGCFLLGI